MNKTKKYFISTICVISLFSVSEVWASEWVIFPSRTITDKRASRSNQNLLLDANNDISEVQYTDLPVKASYSTYNYEQLTPSTITTTKVNKTADYSSNPTWIYAANPQPSTTPNIYRPNYNQEMANYLKETFPMIVHGQIESTQNKYDVETPSSNHLMKGLRSVQDSVFNIVQKVKDFCTYVWKFFIEEVPTQPGIEGRGKKKFKIRKKYKKYLLPLLLAYKLKFFMLVPVMIAGLVLLVKATGLAGFFFALFTAVLALKHGGGGGHGGKSIDKQIY